MPTFNKNRYGPQHTFCVDNVALTISHMRIISLSIHGLVHKDIAIVLGVETATISAHCNRIYNRLREKLDLKEGKRNNTIVNMWAIKNGFKEGGFYNDIFLFDGITNHPFTT